MTRWEAWSFHTVLIVLSVTGVLLFVMKYLMENHDPFQLVNHPWQPMMLDLHILAAPGLVLVLGMIWSSHVAGKLRTRSRSNRRTGILLLAAFPVMVLSGYLIQILVHPTLSVSAVIMHAVSSAIFVLAYVWHQWLTLRIWLRWRRKRKIKSLEPEFRRFRRRRIEGRIFSIR